MPDGTSTTPRIDLYKKLEDLFRESKLETVSAEPPIPPSGDLGPGGKDAATATSTAAVNSATPVATPGADDAPEVALARAIVTQQVEQALDSSVVDVKLARLALAAAGVGLGVDDDTGQPVLVTKDGEEVPLTHQALGAAGLPEILLRSLGKPGSGLVDGKQWNPPSLEDGLRSQETWDANRAAMLQEYSRRRGVRK